MANDRAGLLVIRVWIEPGSSEPLRANARFTSDDSGGFERPLTPARARAVLATVDGGLAHLLSRVAD